MKSESVSADYAEYGEETLVDRARTGDMIACAALMRRYNQRLYRAIRSVLKTGSDVEDTMQDTYVAVLRNLEQFEGRAQFGTWLLKIGTNAALARMRKQMRVVQLDDLPDLDDLEPMLDVDTHAPHTPEQQVSNYEIGRPRRGGHRSAAVRLPAGVHAADRSRGSTPPRPPRCSASERTRSDSACTARERCSRPTSGARSAAAILAAFGFLGRRCNRVVDNVLQRLFAESPSDS